MQDFILKDCLPYDLMASLNFFCKRNNFTIRKKNIKNRNVLVMNEDELVYVYNLMQTYRRETYHKMFSSSSYLSTMQVLKKIVETIKENECLIK